MKKYFLLLLFPSLFATNMMLYQRTTKKPRSIPIEGSQTTDKKFISVFIYEFSETSSVYDFFFSGTGSYPLPPQGLQLTILFTDNHIPTNKPRFFNASIV